MLELVFLFIVIPIRMTRLARERNRSALKWTLATMGAWLGAEFVVGFVVVLLIFFSSSVFGVPKDPDTVSELAYMPALVAALVSAEFMIRRLRAKPRVSRMIDNREDVNVLDQQEPRTLTENVMSNKQLVAPDNTAVRTALWRALHVEFDAPPHVFEDTVGVLLAAPNSDWRSRPDMSPFTRPFRASIVARARFVEDLVAEEMARGVEQYVILGAGLDTFAQRRPDLTSQLRVFEIDQPGPQEWKRQRLIEVGFGIPSFLRLVPVDFEGDVAWWNRLVASGFDATRPAVIASTGLSMYLTREAIMATLRQVATLAPGSTFVMSFMLPIEMLDDDIRPGVERAAEGARASGTPFISFFTPDEILALAREAGLKEVKHVSAAMLAERYFANRTDGLRPPNNSEELLVATT
jgi:methyltransferase (TIGR00027 family)